jgi:hypothetical protein
MLLTALSFFSTRSINSVRVVRLILDDSGFGLGNSSFDFGLIYFSLRVHRGMRNIAALLLHELFRRHRTSDAALQPQSQLTKSIRNYNRIRN